MFIQYYLSLCSILFMLTFGSPNTGVCSISDKSGNLIQVCCADFEERQYQCKECLLGYTSSVGQMCKPCPANTYGKACVNDCNCNYFQRCDNVVGCVDRITTESVTGADQTNSFTSDDFQTTSLLYQTNTYDVNKGTGLSTREVIVYYTLSLAVVILMISLCFVFIKNKRRKRKQTAEISSLRNELMNRIINNIDHLEVERVNVYDEINEVEMVTVDVKPEVLRTNYLEVVHEAGSSTTSSTKSNKSVENGYLNPYQPFVLTNDTKSSYEKLQMETVIMTNDSNKIVIDSQDKDCCETPIAETHSDISLSNGTKSGSYNLVSVGTSCSNKLYDIWTLAKSEHLYMPKIHRQWNGDKERKLMTCKNRFSFISCVDLEKNTHSNLSLSKKYKTF